MRSNVIVRRECQTYETLLGKSDRVCEQLGTHLQNRDRFNARLPLGILLRAIRDRRGFIVAIERESNASSPLGVQLARGNVIFPTALWLELDDGAFECAWMEAYSVVEQKWMEYRVLFVRLTVPLVVPADALHETRGDVLLSEVAASKAMLALTGEEPSS